jgi:hypothetical protein
MNISKMKVAVLDLGLWGEDAIRFARDVAEVIYCVPNMDAFKMPYKDKIMHGMDGVEQVKMDVWFDRLDDMDFIWIPDNACAGLVEWLRRNDYPVGGVGYAEKLETDRYYGREVQQKAGLPVQSTLPLVGVGQLRELMEHGGKSFGRPDFPKQFYVKVDNDYRGIEESFRHDDWGSSEGTLDRIAYKLGPYKEDIKFVCEELLEGEEPGLDGITWEGDLMYPTMGGYEGKGVGIIEKVYRTPEELPPAYNLVHEGLRPSFKKWGTRFFYSTELKMDKQGAPFLIDPTCRKAGPGTSAIQCELIDNYTEVCYGLATGERIDPIMKYKYAAACAFHSEEAINDWVRVQFPKEMRQWVKLRMACKKGGWYYAIPGFDSLGTVIGMGDSVNTAISLVEDRMEQVKCKRIDTGIEKLKIITESIEKGKKVGINF